jgi:hypothetical protein
MVSQARSEEEKTIRRVAASYRKAGYRVAAQPKSDSIPSFLLDCRPDLIAEREDDRVVIEIKAAGSLKGSNDLVELAKRVESEPGWRLELVTFKDTDPDALLITAPWLERMLGKQNFGSQPAGDVFMAAFRLEVLSFMLRSFALRAGLEVKNKLAGDLANELAFEGLIDETLLGRIQNALHWQTNLMRGRETAPSAVDQTAEIEAICREIYTRITFPED